MLGPRWNRINVVMLVIWKVSDPNMEQGHFGNLESSRSLMEQDSSLINRAGIMESYRSQIEQNQCYHVGNLESVKSRIEQGHFGNLESIRSQMD